MPRVSVIIPTYNRYKSLCKAIESVFNQSYRSFEIIVIDDGSSDNTNNIQQNYPSILYFYQKNQGRSAARNRGVALANGEYIAFLDSDDLFLPDKLSLQVDFLDRNPDIGMVYTFALCIDERGFPLRHAWKGRLEGFIYPKMLTIKNNLITTPSVMVRSSVLNEVGGFDQEMDMCEDLDLWRRIAKLYKVGLIRKYLVKVTIRTREVANLYKYINAREYFYHKSIANDSDLSKKFIDKLYSEMYRYYALSFISRGNYVVARDLISKSIHYDRCNVFTYIYLMFKLTKAFVKRLL